MSSEASLQVHSRPSRFDPVRRAAVQVSVLMEAKIGGGFALKNGAIRSGKLRMISMPNWLIFTLMGLEYCCRMALVESAVDENA